MKICLVKTSSIGDISHSAFIPEMIKTQIPHAVIHWYCDQNFTDILQGNIFISKICTVFSKGANNSKWQFIKQLFQLKKQANQEQYDIVIDLQGSLKSSLIAKALCTNKHLWGFKHTRDLLANKLYPHHSHIPLSANIYRRNLQLINDALETQCNLNKISIPYLYTKYDATRNQNKFTRKHILIFPSSSNDNKNYSMKHYRDLIVKLKDYSITLLYGSIAEKDLCNEIAGNTGKIHIVGNFTLENIKGLLTKMDCVIGADTGILHMASALGVKNITLYGSTPAYRTSINLPHSVSLQGNGNVNKIPIREILQTLKFLNV